MRGVGRRVWSVVAAATLTSSGRLAAQAPDTDVWLAPIEWRGDSLVVGAPRNVTKRPGYDNQPSFTADAKAILYTSIREDGQADVHRYDLASGATTRLTATPESEYSPTVTPDGKFFSVVRVERDSTQRLWKFPLAGSEPSLVLPDVKPVGYHAWVDDTTLALFVLGRPATLQVANVRTGGARHVASGIGRAIQAVPSRPGSFTFVQRDSARGTALVRASIRDTITYATPFVGEYHAWSPEGRLVASEPQRFRWLAAGDMVTGRSPGRFEVNPVWKYSADLGHFGLRQISRLAISPDGRWLAFVAEPTP